MSRIDRMIADLDTEIAETESKLSRLKEVRRMLSGGRSPRVARKAEPRENHESEGASVAVDASESGASRSIAALLADQMGDHQEWTVEELAQVLAAKNIPRNSVNAALHRGSLGVNALFVRERKGVYRLKRRPTPLLPNPDRAHDAG